VPAPPPAYHFRLLGRPDDHVLLAKDEAVPCEGARCTFAMEARDLQTGRTWELFRITAAGVWTAGASVSPDAREVAFIARDGPATTIMIAPTAGGPPREIGRVNYDLVGQTAWTPDGGRVLSFRALVSGGELWSFSRERRLAREVCAAHPGPRRRRRSARTVLTSPLSEAASRRKCG